MGRPELASGLTPKLDIDRQIVEAYRRIPQGEVDRWGDLGEQLAGHARELAHRLDLEDGGWNAAW